MTFGRRCVWPVQAPERAVRNTDFGSQLIREAYRIRGAKYLVIKGDGGAYWSNVASMRDHSVTEDGLVDSL